MTPAEAYAQADRAFRVIVPQFLAYEDGKRQAFPHLAKIMRDYHPIRTSQQAQFAINTLAQVITPPLMDVRDGQLTVPTRQCHWLLQAAQQIDAGYAVPCDYGYKSFKDLSDSMEIPIRE